MVNSLKIHKSVSIWPLINLGIHEIESNKTKGIDKSAIKVVFYQHLVM